MNGGTETAWKTRCDKRFDIVSDEKLIGKISLPVLVFTRSMEHPPVPAWRARNTKGWRSDVVGALNDLHVPLVRWPGGCFADEYHWKDVTGPRDRCPVKLTVARRTPAGHDDRPGRQ